MNLGPKFIDREHCEFWSTSRMFKEKALFSGRMVTYGLRLIQTQVMLATKEIESPYQATARMLRAILLLDEAKSRMLHPDPMLRLSTDVSIDRA